MPGELPQIPVILGVTASGKSQYAFQLAQERGAEIISCDSMQVYRGLEIGTAQPSAEMLQAVPHHGIGTLEISEPYDVNRFLAFCRNAIAEIQARGHEVVIVGGTGLYARALVYGLSLLPSDPELAGKLRILSEQEEGREELRAVLTEAAKRVGEMVPPDLLRNPRRLARAAEVFYLTGKLPWHIETKTDLPDPRFQQICLMPSMERLRENIRRRTAQMLQMGWLEEAREAIARGLLQSPTARQALGYREIAQYFEGTLPCRSLAELETWLANRTIQYARRQMTWFRHQHPGQTVLPIS